MLKNLINILIVLALLIVISCNTNVPKTIFTANQNKNEVLNAKVIDFVEDILHHKHNLAELLNEYLKRVNQKDEILIKDAVDCQNVMKNVTYDSINVVYDICKTDNYNQQVVKYYIEVRYFIKSNFTRKVFLKFEELNEKLYLTYSSDVGFEPVLFGKEP